MNWVLIVPHSISGGPPLRYKRYLTHGYEGLALSSLHRQSGWNQLPPAQKSRVLELALERPELSCRELACYVVDNEG